MNIVLLVSILLSPSNPEDFLNELCINSIGQEGAEYWSTHAHSAVPDAMASADSLFRFLQDRNQLAVDPGPRTAFVEEDNGFRVEFAQSEWTWTDESGNSAKKDGLSIVYVINGGYYWAELPLSDSGSLIMGTKESLISGIMLTFLLMIVAGVLVAWARRRFV
jgi:hypothetical protein